MGDYGPDEFVGLASPLLVPAQPESLNWGSDDGMGFEDITNSEASWNPAARDRNLSHAWDDNTQLSLTEKNRDIAGWVDTIYVPLKNPRPSWDAAAEVARMASPLNDLGDRDKTESLNRGPPPKDDLQAELEALEYPEPPRSRRQPTLGAPQARKTSRPRRVRKRFGLPLLMDHPSGISEEIMACPDSGSDENIISLDLANTLGLKIEQTSSDDPRQFAVANGKIVTAVGQVSTRCSFATGAPSATASLECIFHVFNTLAVPLIMGIDFLQQTETLSIHKDRLVELPGPAMQSLRVNSVGRPKRSLVCRLDDHVGFATVDTGSDLDLVSPEFAKSGAYNIEPAYEQVEFADCSVGYIFGVIRASLAVGKASCRGFYPRGESIDLELFVLDNLNADILVGQDTVEILDVFNLHSESLIPSIPRLGESELSIIRHIGGRELRTVDIWNKLRRIFGCKLLRRPEEGTGSVPSQDDLDQQENARRERERARIAKLSGTLRDQRQYVEDRKIEAFETARQMRASPSIQDSLAAMTPSSPTSSVSPGGESSRSMAADVGDSEITRMRIEGTTNPPPIEGGYRCTFEGCTAPPFRTQWLLNSHTNAHSSARLHYCPVEGCRRGRGGRGFIRRDEMILHDLAHYLAGYFCPFCPDRDHKHPMPVDLQQHVRLHHPDQDTDDPVLQQVLARQPDGPTALIGEQEGEVNPLEGLWSSFRVLDGS